MTTHPVGIVGLGGVGLAVTGRLRGAGMQVLGFRRGDFAAFRALGGAPCRTIDELVGACRVVLNCAPQSASADIANAYTRSAPKAGSGRILVDLGVASIASRIALRDALAAVGSTMLDAPIMGNPPLIEQGKAVIYASGDKAAADSVADVLQIIAADVPHVGAFGNGTRLKFTSNLLLAVHTAAAAEAVAYAMQSNLDPAALLAHLPPIAQSGVLSMRGPSMVQRRFGKASGSNRLLLEVIQQIRADAAVRGHELPMLEATERQFQRAVDAGLGDVDTPSLVDLFAPTSQ